MHKRRHPGALSGDWGALLIEEELVTFQRDWETLLMKRDADVSPSRDLSADNEEEPRDLSGTARLPLVAQGTRRFAGEVWAAGLHLMSRGAVMHIYTTHSLNCMSL